MPDGVRILDGGTLGLSLLPILEDAERAILVDAIRDDQTPGSFVRLTGDAVAPAVPRGSPCTRSGVVDLLDGARWLGRTPSTLVLLGLVPLSVELSVALSAPVEHNLPELVRRIAAESSDLGFPLRPRSAHAPRAVFGSLVGIDAVGL